MDESVPLRPFSLAQAVSSFAGSLSFETTREVWGNEDKADFHENIQKNPVYDILKYITVAAAIVLIVLIIVGYRKKKEFNEANSH